LGINKRTGCGGDGLDYKFQIEKSVNKKSLSFGHQQAHWLWRRGAGLQIPGRKVSKEKKLVFWSSKSHAAVSA
jgi:hypothetical protein